MCYNSICRMNFRKRESELRENWWIHFQKQTSLWEALVEKINTTVVDCAGKCGVATFPSSGKSRMRPLSSRLLFFIFFFLENPLKCQSSLTHNHNTFFIDFHAVGIKKQINFRSCKLHGWNDFWRVHYAVGR